MTASPSVCLRLGSDGKDDICKQLTMEYKFVSPNFARPEILSKVLNKCDFFAPLPPKEIDLSFSSPNTDKIWKENFLIMTSNTKFEKIAAWVVYAGLWVIKMKIRFPMLQINKVVLMSLDLMLYKIFHLVKQDIRISNNYRVVSYLVNQ